MTYDEAMQQIKERQAANRKALAEATARRDSGRDKAKKFGFAAKFCSNRTLHAKLTEVIGGMIRK